MSEEEPASAVRRFGYSSYNFCGNIFLVNSVIIPGYLAAAEKFITYRKLPVKLCSILGMGFLLKFTFGTLTFDSVEKKVFNLLGSRRTVVLSPYPEIGIDVDKQSDFELVQAAYTQGSNDRPEVKLLRFFLEMTGFLVFTQNVNNNKKSTNNVRCLYWRSNIWKSYAELKELQHLLKYLPTDLTIFILWDNFSGIFWTAKSILSEDMSVVKESFERFGLGTLETISRPAGGLRFLSYRPQTATESFLTDLAGRLSALERVISGGFIYMSDNCIVLGLWFR